MGITRDNAVINRMKEPSTAAGLAALAVAFGMPVEVAGPVVNGLVGLAGLLAVVLPERK